MNDTSTKKIDESIMNDVKDIKWYKDYDSNMCLAKLNEPITIGGIECDMAHYELNHDPETNINADEVYLADSYGGINSMVSSIPEITDPDIKATLASKLHDELLDIKIQSQLDKASKKAQSIYNNFDEKATKDNAPYLVKHNINGYDARIFDHYELPQGTAFVPVRDIDGNIKGGQFLLGEKNDKGKDTLILSGTDRKGNFHLIDKDKSNKQEKQPLIITDNYKSGASIHQATKLPVAVALDSDNLESVADAMRDKYPNKPIVIASSNDMSNDKSISEISNIKIINPSFNDAEKAQGLNDFNDLANSRGNDAVKQSFKAEMSASKKLSKDNGIEL